MSSRMTIHLLYQKQEQQDQGLLTEKKIENRTS